MRTHALDIHYSGFDPFFINARAVSVLGKIALRVGKMLQEFRLDGLSAAFLGKTERTACVVDDLHCLDSR